MPDHRKLFAVTQWVLRAGIIVTMLLIGMFVLGEAATIFALSTSRVPLDKIARWTGVTMTADEIGRMALAAVRWRHRGPRAHPVHLPRFAARGRQRQCRRSIHRGECRGARARRLAPPRRHRDRRADQADGLPARARRRAREGPRNGPYLGDRAVRCALIFVLAQIFRRGSEMRAELAGTI